MFEPIYPKVLVDPCSLRFSWVTSRLRVSFSIFKQKSYLSSRLTSFWVVLVGIRCGARGLASLRVVVVVCCFLFVGFQHPRSRRRTLDLQKVGSRTPQVRLQLRLHFGHEQLISEDGRGQIPGGQFTSICLRTLFIFPCCCWF